MCEKQSCRCTFQFISAQLVASTHLSHCPSVHPPMLVWECRGESVDTVNPVAEPSQDGGQRKWEDGGRIERWEGGEVCLCSPLSLKGGLAYLDWFQPQQQLDGAPAFHPLSSPQHPNLITQPCDSGLEPRGRETDRREGREREWDRKERDREERDRERLDFMSSNIAHIYQFHFHSNRTKFGGWRFVSNHLSAQFIKRPQRHCLLAQPMGMT